jgi:hypothetical protein
MCFAWMVKITHGVLSCLQTAVCKLPLGMLAQRGQNYEHVHIISTTQISFSYVQISVSIQIRRSREKIVKVEYKFVEVELKFVEVELKFVEVELKFVEVEVEIRRSRQTNRRSRMLKHPPVQYDNFL